MNQDLDRAIKSAVSDIVAAAPVINAEFSVLDQLDTINDDHIVRFTPQRDNRTHRPLLLTVAAAAILVVGAGGLIWTQRTEPVPPATAVQVSTPVDPPTQLFVLPTDPQELELSSGEVFSSLDEGTTPSDTPVMVIGTEIDGGFTDLVDIRVFGQIPDGFDGNDVSEVGTPTGPALINSDKFPIPTVAQQRGNDWLLLSGTSDEQDLIDLISQVSINSAGAPTIDSEQRVVVDEVRRNESATNQANGVYSTFYIVTDPASGITFEVATATAPSAALLGTPTRNPIRPTTVNGTAAWILTRNDEPAEGASVGIAWRASPNRVIVVGAQAPLEQVQAMADRLQQVTEEEWFAALPEATITN